MPTGDSCFHPRNVERGQERTIPFTTPEESAEMAKATLGEMGELYPYVAEVVVAFSETGYD